MSANEVLNGPANTDLPVVLVGDLNSTTTATSYLAFAGSGFMDIWATLFPGDPGFTCCQVLPTIEIKPVKELYDYECKYTPGMAEEFVAELSPEIQSKLADQAWRAFEALKLRGYARIDFRLDPQGQPWCLEANTLPGMTRS